MTTIGYGAEVDPGFVEVVVTEPGDDEEDEEEPSFWLSANFVSHRILI